MAVELSEWCLTVESLVRERRRRLDVVARILTRTRVRSGTLNLMLAGILLGVASVAHAQTSSPPAEPPHEGMGYGVKAGPVVLLDSSDQNVQYADHPATWAGGLFFDSNWPSRFAIEVDALLLRRSLRTHETFDSKYFLELPALLRLNPIGTHLGRASVFVVTGPTFDIRVYGTAVEPGSRWPDLRDFDVSWAFGGGFEFRRLVGELRYIRSFNQLTVKQSYDLRGLQPDEMITPQSVSFMLGIRFN